VNELIAMSGKAASCAMTRAAAMVASGATVLQAMTIAAVARCERRAACALSGALEGLVGCIS